MGGAEVLRLSVLEELLRRNDLDVRVCVLRDRGVLADRVVQLGIPLDVLGNRGGLLDVAGVLRLARYLRAHRPDVVQSSQFLTNLHTRLAGWLARTPSVIIEEHGIYGWKRWYHRALDRWVNGRAQAVVACSHCVARSAASNLGVDESKITVIHNCAAASHFTPVGSDAGSSRLELAGQSSFSIVTVGTLRWEKGHRFLLQAWKQLQDDGAIPADEQLWIVGSGPLESQLRGEAENIPGVQFLGRRTDTLEILRAADLFVLPSVNEGFGIAIVEAMCAGLAVVSTQSGGIPEVVDDGRTGILVDPGSADELAGAIKRLHDNRDEREEMARAGRAAANDRFTPARYVQQLMNLYESLGPPSPNHGERS